MRKHYALALSALLPVLFILSGCSALGSQDAAKNAGKGLASQGGDAAKNAGQRAGDWAMANPDVAAALLVAAIGAWFIRWLWRSAQIKYLIFGALVVWIAYTAGVHHR